MTFLNDLHGEWLVLMAAFRRCLGDDDDVWCVLNESHYTVLRDFYVKKLWVESRGVRRRNSCKFLRVLLEVLLRQF